MLRNGHTHAFAQHDSFRTYVNAAAWKYNLMEPADGVFLLPSSVKQFRVFNEVMSKALTREARSRALLSGPEVDNEILQASELPLLFNDTQMSSAYQTQRYNAVYTKNVR